MKTVLIINLSPRKKGTSVMLAHRCQEFLEKGHSQVTLMHLYAHLNDLAPVLAGINGAKTIIMIGPCYIDTYPADTIYLLEAMEKNQEILHGQNLYGIIQGGMPYVHTHESGLRTLACFASENNLNYQGGFVMGLGAMLNGETLEKLPNGKKVARQFELFLNHVSKDEASPKSVYDEAQLKMPGWVYGMMAKAMNRKIDHERREMGIRDNEKSPYER